MEKYLKMFLAVAIVLMSVSCGGMTEADSAAGAGTHACSDARPNRPHSPVQRHQATFAVAAATQLCERIRTGMTPFYLADKPSVLRINVGRQLFVDNFPIASTTLKRTFHYPEYHSANPVLCARPAAGKSKVQREDSPPRSATACGTTNWKASSKCGIWPEVAHMPLRSGITCYAESNDGISWIGRR